MTTHINCGRKKIAVVATSPKMVRYFLVFHILRFTELYDVVVITNYADQSENLDIFPDNVKKYNIPIVRDINIFLDCKALLFLIYYFYREKITLVYSISPKGGLLSMMASKFLSVPVRMHTFTGQVWFARKGITRWLLKMMDRITSLLSTVVIVDSPSQREYLVEHKVVTHKKSLVIGNGSISGVDTKRFHPSKDVREVIREKVSIQNSTIVFLFVGRLKKDKGIFELINAFTNISPQKKISLWFVGDDEEDILKNIKTIESAKRYSIEFLPFTTIPEEYMQAADVFCLPSYREGFGSTIIEAAACGIPAIGSRIYGITDTIIDGETGILVEKGNVHELASAMLEMAENDYLRKKMGAYAMKVAIEKFKPDYISKELVSILKKQLIQAEIVR